MKSLNFRRKETAPLRYIEEKPSQNKSVRFNWDRVVYLSVLGLIVFFVLRYFYINNFYIEADGQVIFDNVNISHTDDLRLEQIFVEEGESVLKGDTLFTYVIENDPVAGTVIPPPEGGASGSSWSEREVYTLTKNIELNNGKIRGDQQLLTSYKSQLSQLQNEVILGAASERDINNLEYQISKLETSISLTQSENGVLRKQLSALQAKNTQDIAEENQRMTAAAAPGNQVFISPIDGYISRVFKEPYEVALKSQSILTIHQSDSVHVKGYFDQEDLRYVEVGDHVHVDFPDGAESEGVIKRFYASTVLIPAEFQEKYEPAKRTIAVDIIPAPGSNLEIWKRYYKLSVKLNKRTF